MSSSNGEALRRELPAGWEWVTLDQVFSTITDGDHAAPPQVNEGVPFLVIGNVRHGFVDFTNVRFVPRDYYEGVGESRKPRQGDLLYTVTGSFGITVVVTSEQEFCVQRHIAILKPGPLASVRYLAFALETSEAYLQAVKAATGTAQKTVGLIRLRKFRVPFAPMSEQDRVVEALESYFTRLDDAVATLERVERNLKRYRASVLKSAVEGRLVPTEAELAKQEGGRDYEPAAVLLERILKERRHRWEEAELAKMEAKGKPPKDGKWKAKYKEPAAPDTTNLPELPEGWRWASVDALAAVKGGITKGQKKKPGVVMREIPYLRVANVQRGYLDLAVMKMIDAPESKIQELLLRAGDVLFNEGGDRDKLGRGWVWSGELEECIHQNHVFRARIFTDDLLPKFLSWFGNGEGQKYFFDQGKQTTNLASINLTKLKSFPVPVPPKAEQIRISEEVERLLSVSDDAITTASREIKRCQRLRQAILKWAFEGKLADQDPNDEPASVLLDRIKAEREAATPPKKSTRRKGGGKKVIRA